MRSFFYKDAPQENMRTEPQLQLPILQRQHKAFSQLVLDVELVVIVLLVAFILHSVARVIWANFNFRLQTKKGRKDREHKEALLPKASSEPRGTFPRDLPPPSYGTGVFAKVVHEKLGSVSEQELMPFVQEHCQSFSVANTVHAVVKCGKLQVQPGPAWLALVDKVSTLVPKLKVRGLVHVLWGLAKVKGPIQPQVLDDIVQSLCTKWAELKGSDLASAVWAVAELRDDEAASYTRVVKVLSCSGKALQASLPSITREELCALLETLASAKLAPPPGESAPAAPLVVTCCTQLLNLSKKPKAKLDKKNVFPLPDTVKVVGALSELIRTGTIGADREPGELLRAFAMRVADVKTAKGSHFRSAVATLAKLRVEDVGVQVFDKLARAAVVLNLHALPRKQLVQLASCLAPVAAQHTLECGSEFFLELAQQLNALEPALGRDDAEVVRKAFDQVGYGSMLRER